VLVDGTVSKTLTGSVFRSSTILQHTHVPTNENPLQRTHSKALPNEYLSPLY
jgi:hypothetical protein